VPLSRLNKEQYEAATAPFGQNLIIASAGTGKTSTIVGRIAYLLQQNIEPESILLLTFTNKAAAEMIERVAAIFDADIANRIDAGTFHAVSYRWLKKSDSKVVLKQPAELKTLFRSVYEKRSFSHIDSETPPYMANYLYDLYSLYQNTSFHLPFEQYIGENYSEHSCYSAIYADMIDEFEHLKKRYGFLNFNDLLLNMLSYANENELGYHEILVDEYQDTNTLQGELLDTMRSRSLFCVGDYDQSIYAFNGADITIIGSFQHRYPHATIFTLTKNYRSTVPILSLANRVIEKNERIYPKRLEVTRSDPNIAPKLLIFDELYAQYHGIAESIMRSSSAHDDIAVIFRNNSTADGIEASLRERNIACRRRGGVSFFDAKEIKVMLDIYTLFVNESDMMAFIHILEYAHGVGSATAKEVFVALETLGHGSMLQGLYHPDKSIRDPFEKRTANYQLGLFDDIFEADSREKFLKLDISRAMKDHPVLNHPKLTQEGALMLDALSRLLKTLSSLKRAQQVVKRIAQSKVLEMVETILLKRRSVNKDGTIDESKKQSAKLAIIRKKALLEELAKPYHEHERFLNAMILGSQDLTQGEGVHLLSIHASKGLEYKEVYVIDLMDGRFPNRKLMRRGGSLDEERRLFYVAVTRAKDILYLSFAKYDQVKKIDFVASQFLYEAGLLALDENFKKLVHLEEERET